MVNFNNAKGEQIKLYCSNSWYEFWGGGTIINHRNCKVHIYLCDGVNGSKEFKEI